MNNFNLKYFLAANSCEGFVSSFGECYDAAKGWKAYIIKGGPGTGKSSFMKYMASKAEQREIKIELCPCSSDPDSLDAVIFPDMKTVILDGTAPHVVEPIYPGVCEEILNFGQFWNSDSFKATQSQVLSLTDKNKALHRSASRYLQAVGQLMTDNLKTARYCTNREKASLFAKNLCKKHIPKRDGMGFEWVRYLSGITPKGVVSFAGTVLSSCNNTIIIEDDFGIVADTIMNRIREYCLSCGYEIITVKNAFLPSILTDHIIIPELSLAFVRESEYQHFACDGRRIHSRRFTSAAQISKSRERIKFNKKAIRQLLFTACAVLGEAKSIHDNLEAHYISAMNFESLTKFANEFEKKIFG